MAKFALAGESSGEEYCLTCCLLMAIEWLNPTLFVKNTSVFFLRKIMGIKLGNMVLTEKGDCGDLILHLYDVCIVESHLVVRYDYAMLPCPLWFQDVCTTIPEDDLEFVLIKIGIPRTIYLAFEIDLRTHKVWNDRTFCKESMKNHSVVWHKTQPGYSGYLDLATSAVRYFL